MESIATTKRNMTAQEIAEVVGMKWDSLYKRFTRSGMEYQASDEVSVPDAVKVLSELAKPHARRPAEVSAAAASLLKQTKQSGKLAEGNAIKAPAPKPEQPQSPAFKPKPAAPEPWRAAFQATTKPEPKPELPAYKPQPSALKPEPPNPKPELKPEPPAPKPEPPKPQPPAPKPQPPKPQPEPKPEPPQKAASIFKKINIAALIIVSAIFVAADAYSAARIGTQTYGDEWAGYLFAIVGFAIGYIAITSLIFMQTKEGTGEILLAFVFVLFQFFVHFLAMPEVNWGMIVICAGLSAGTIGAALTLKTLIK